jgi:hypothetical protein
VLYIFCALCVFNTILFPTLERSFQNSTQGAVLQQDASMLDFMMELFSTEGDLSDEETDDQTEETDFLFSHVTNLTDAKGSEIASNKIPTHQSLLMHPLLEKFTPPPKSNS